MAYILDQERSKDCSGAFQRYRQYLDRMRQTFPQSALKLATSDWYFDFNDPRCPHDARLDSATILEETKHTHSTPRPVSIRIRISLAHAGRLAEFFYPTVSSYTIQGIPTAGGHQDWRYDEFKLSDSGLLIHEIEWCGAHGTARWVIEASDVQYRIFDDVETSRPGDK